MKRMQRVFGDLDALLFVDNRLDDDRRAAFLAHLADDPHESERVATWARQNDVIRASFAGIAIEPVPLWLRLGHMATERSTVRDLPSGSDRRLRGEARPTEPRPGPRRPDQQPNDNQPPHRRRFRSASVGASAAALLVAGLLVLVGARTLLPQAVAVDEAAVREADATTALVARASDAYRTYALDPLHPVEVSASQQSQLDHWLQHRVGLAVHAPDLRGEGWTALGGRLVPGEAGPAAYYVYESEPGERLGVYIGRTATVPSTALALDSMTGGGAVLSWVSGQTAYVVTAGRSLDWLSRNAEELRSRVARPPAGVD